MRNPYDEVIERRSDRIDLNGWFVVVSIVFVDVNVLLALMSQKDGLLHNFFIINC